MQCIRVTTLPCHELRFEMAHIILRQQFAFRVITLDGTDGGWRGEHDFNFMFRNHPPECPRIRRAHGFAFIQHGCASLEERGVNNIGMANNPPNIRCRPKNIPRVTIIDIFHRPFQRHDMGTGGTNHAFRNTRGARGIENITRV